MTSHPDEPDVERAEGDADQGGGGAGVEIGRTDGDGTTFEPEEDPEAHAD